MKLLEQFLSECGADLSQTLTIIPSFGAYVCGVKRVEEYTPQKLVLATNKFRLTLSGNNIIIRKYFMQDLFVMGEVAGVTIE